MTRPSQVGEGDRLHGAPCSSLADGDAFGDAGDASGETGPGDGEHEDGAEPLVGDHVLPCIPRCASAEGRLRP